MLVTRVIGDCPGCGGSKKYGNVSVRGDHILRGCLSCRYKETIWLPETRKKILYLDQFFFSTAFRDRDARFVEAANIVRRVSALQLLAVPYSSIHEDETHQWRGFDGKNKDDLMAFIKATSRGHEFEAACQVEESQIVRAFQAFTKGAPTNFELKERDVIEKEIHEWDDYFRIEVGRYLGDIELIRDLKTQSVASLIDIFPEWRKSQSTFEEDIKLELSAAIKGYIDSYVEFAWRVGSGDCNALFDSPIMSKVVQSLMYCLSEELEIEQKFARIGEFFRSEYFSQVPYQWISVRAYAALKDMVRNGAYQNRAEAIQRLNGFFQDIKHVATYSPYCDAVVLDKAMASLVADPRIGLEKRYGVKVFSLNNWDEFIGWLLALEENMTEEHRAALSQAYP